jgi:hypothetical protein
MENLMLDFASTSDMAENLQAHEKQIHEKHTQAVIDGVDELAAYAGKRPIQCFTMKMPFPLFLKFKRLIQKAKDEADEADKGKYTMTAYVNSAVEKVIIPALEESLGRGEVA